MQVKNRQNIEISVLYIWGASQASESSLKIYTDRRFHPTQVIIGLYLNIGTHAMYRNNYLNIWVCLKLLTCKSNIYFNLKVQSVMTSYT